MEYQIKIGERVMQKGKLGMILLGGLLLVSVGGNIYLATQQRTGSQDGMLEYMTSPKQVEIMSAGILKANSKLQKGKDVTFQYEFSQDDFDVLREEYAIEDIAGDGSELERAVRIMDEFSGRLSHVSNFDNSVEMTAKSLLEYCLDSKEYGINCRNKAQVMNELCLALHIYSRKLWIMPNSSYDDECHCVNEIWDSARKKWVMLDISNNMYWVDEEGNPLSALEIRQKCANQEFCTPIKPGDSTEQLEKLKERYYGHYIYTMKNMAYFQYLAKYSVGEDKETYLLLPESYTSDSDNIISEQSILAPPTFKAE